MIKFKNGSYGYETAEYPARVSRVIDGDTVILTVDQGLRGMREEAFRLIGADAPELRGAEAAEGARAKEALIEMLVTSQPPSAKWPLHVEIHKGKSFDRWLANIFWTDTNGVEKSAAAELISQMLAKPA